MPTFELAGRQLAYTEYGSGPRVTVLVHGLLLSQKMHAPLARALAERGNRVITIDVLGHGRSDRPTEMREYSMGAFGVQVLALLDHLEVKDAVLLGTSLGANTALEAAVRAPERLRGMVIEMPVLEHALLGCALAFTPLMVALTFGAPVMRLVQRAARALPSGLGLLDVPVDTLRQDPEPGAAVLQGLFFSRVAPPREERVAITTPTLIIGHHRDPIHPFSDSGMLAEELPNARLLEAESILELRIAPKRLTDEIADFIDDCWAPAERRRRGRAAA